MPSLTIGKVAQRASIGIETVRFYEREGLIDEPPRGPSPHGQLAFIKRSSPTRTSFTIWNTATCGLATTQA